MTGYAYVVLPTGILRSGDVLSGRYRVIRRIATGGMGEVWQAADLVLSRLVAVKVLLPTLVGNPRFETRFRDEARLLATLQHPGVVNVYDYRKSFVASGAKVAFLVMAYVDGLPLSRWIARVGRLSVAQAASVAAQAADALHAAHLKGIVHSDVKPANLLVRRDGTVVLVDFGVAHSAAVDTLGGNSVLGTPVYMAPEQATNEPISAATDVYALGTVMYHCLAGRPPFTGDDPLEVAAQHVRAKPPPLPADIPAPIQVLVLQAMAKRPSSRPPSGAAFAAAVRAAASGPGTLRATPTLITARTGGRMTAPTAARRHRGRRIYAVAAGVAVLAALAAGATVTGLRGEGGVPRQEAPASTPSSSPAPSAVPSDAGGTGSADDAGQAPPDRAAHLPWAPRTTRQAPTPWSTTVEPVPHQTGSRPAGLPATPPSPPEVSTEPASPSPMNPWPSPPEVSTEPAGPSPTNPRRSPSPSPPEVSTEPASPSPMYPPPSPPEVSTEPASPSPTSSPATPPTTIPSAPDPGASEPAPDPPGDAASPAPDRQPRQ